MENEREKLISHGQQSTAAASHDPKVFSQLKIHTSVRASVSRETFSNFQLVGKCRAVPCVV